MLQDAKPTKLARGLAKLRSAFSWNKTVGSPGAAGSNNSHNSLREYAAAMGGRLNSDWTASGLSGNQEVYASLPVMRARSRQAARDNAYARRAIWLLTYNVVGRGAKLDSRITKSDGQPDTETSAFVEKAFAEWSKPKNASVCKRRSFAGIQRQILQALVRDGEVLVWPIFGYKGNPFGFALQVLESDYLAENKNEDLSNGNRVRMGVEVDSYGAPVAYHLFKDHPGDYYLSTYAYGQTVRVPADEILHIFIPDRPGQVRSVPWFHAVLPRLHRLDSYEEAELIAARIAAAKMGFFTSEHGGVLAPHSGKDESGNLITDVEPGIFEVLPPGFDLKTFDASHPSQTFGDFVTANLRGVSAGVNLSYTSMSRDLAGVSFSSLRHDAIDERDYYTVMQDETCEWWSWIFEKWLDWSLLTQKLKLKYSDFDRLNNPQWTCKRWQWVDPRNEMQANREAVALKIKSRSSIISEAGSGANVEDVFREIAEEEKLAQKYGVDLSLSTPGSTPGKVAQESANDADGGSDQNG